MAAAAGYDALKVNPLRGWDTRKFKMTGIQVTAFEYLWRPNFRASIQNLQQHKDWMGFIADTCFIGYRGALSRSECYGIVFPALFPDVVGIDCPDSLEGNFVRARETECAPEKWPLPLDDDYLACLDTWHVRTYPNPDAIIERLAKSNRIALIDIQTRDLTEWINWIRHPCRTDTTLLGHQLAMLRGLPESISASIEIAPQHLLGLMRSLSLSYEGALHEVRQAARLALG